MSEATTPLPCPDPAALSPGAVRAGSPGPKPVLDEHKRGRVCGMIAMGSSRCEAAKAVGCHVSTISRTMERDPDFAQQVQDAEFLARERPLAAMCEAVGKHWRAAAWMLERTRPEDFGRHRATSRREREDEADDRQQNEQYERQPLVPNNWRPTFTQEEVRLMFHRLLLHTWDKIPQQQDRDYVERIAHEIIDPPPGSSHIPWQDWDRERAIRETYEQFQDGGRDPMGVPYAGRGEFQQPLYREEDGQMEFKEEENDIEATEGPE